MDGETVLHTCRGTLFSPKREDNPTIVTARRALEDMAPAEIRQTLKDKYVSSSLSGGISNSPAAVRREEDAEDSGTGTRKRRSRGTDGRSAGGERSRDPLCSSEPTQTVGG